MKKIIIFMLLFVVASKAIAQDIKITKFERNITSLIASTNAAYDNAGEACAVVRFFVRDVNIIIEPNLGVVKKETKPGEVRLWIPKGTKRITVRRKGLIPLNGYVIPVAIESKVTYDAVLSINDAALKRNQANKGHNVYVGAGYNIMSISGPSVALGFDIKNHNIELGAVYGLNKTDDLYFYDSNSNVTEAYNYQAIRIQLRYGYDFKITDFFSVMPQVGGAYNIVKGNEVVKGNGAYDSGNSFSAICAVRLQASLNDNFKLHITPEYDIKLNRNDVCEWLSNSDSTVKNWTDGFNLNVGLIYFF